MRLGCRLGVAVLAGCLGGAWLGVVPAGAQQSQQTGQGVKEVRIPSVEPVVVTATRTPAPAGGVAGSLDVVGAETIAALAAPDVKAALNLVPTLLLNDVGTPGGIATVTLRGSTSQQVLVLLDGHRVANAQSSWFNLNDIPLPASRIERIEVLPTPASALYGADALGGVVNVITKPIGTKPELALSLGSGTDNEWRTAGGAQVGLGKVGLRVDGQLRTGDGFRPNGDFDQKTVVAAAALAPAPWGFDVTWQYLKREEGVPGPLAFPSPTARQKDDKRVVRGGASYVSPGGWDFKLGASTQTQTLDFKDPSPPSFDPAFPASPVASRHENRSHGGDFQWDLDTGAGELYTLGGEWTQDRILSTNDGDHETERWGLYAQDQWRVGNWSAIGAIRRDDHSVYGGQTSPSLSIIWGADGWQLWGAVARGYRAPNFDDLYWNEPFLKGNPDLKPESSWSWEGGLEKSWAGAGKARFTYFNRKVEDLIQWVADDGFVYRPENVAAALVRGYEVTLEYRPVAGLAIPVGYQNVSSEDEATGKELPGSLRSLWRVGAQYTGGSFTWSLEWWRTDRGRYRYRDAAWAYDVLNAALSWRGKLASLPVTASVRLENLQNHSYETVEGYPMPGRTVFMEVGIGL